MPRLVVSIDGVVIKEIQITKDRSTIGRRPYNDLVIDNLAVSGEHAQVRLTGGRATLEDLGSTNGTYVNGRPIKSQALANNDIIEIGKYKLKYIDSGADALPAQPSAPAPVSGPHELLQGIQTKPHDIPTTLPFTAHVRLINGVNAGREIALNKPLTTLGKPGVVVAGITRNPTGWTIAHVEGDTAATVNGVSVRDAPIPLKNHDQIELGGIQLEFSDH